MSRHPQPQLRDEIRDRTADAAHWQARLNDATDDTERATFQRAVDRAKADAAEAQRRLDAFQR